MDWLMIVYMAYLFGLSIWNAFASGARLSSEKRWDKVVGTAALATSVLGLTYGFSLILGVPPLFTVYLLIAPLVGLGLIITVDTWYLYQETKSKFVLLLAIYNTVVSVWNLMLAIKILKDVKAQDIAKLAPAVGAGVLAELSNIFLLLLSAIMGLVLAGIVCWLGYKVFKHKDVRKVPDKFRKGATV